MSVAPPQLPIKQESPVESRGRAREKRFSSGPSAPTPQRKRQTRWSDHASKTFVPGIPTFIPSCLSKQELDALLLRIRIEEIGYKIQNNQLDAEYYRSRSPSPTPVYDPLGRRVNTKDQRAKQRLERERVYLIDKAVKINPHFKPPHDYRPQAAKKTKKIYIPVKQYPEYNFIGLIIGPRGLTQKHLEKESGSKIVIRGKGSVKDGRQSYEDDKDELHVLISADTNSQLRKAAKMVKKLLVPVEEGKNQHKIEQLRKLAEINGTLRDNNAWQPRTWQSADVYCKHCGEISHPTADCPLKGKPVDKEAIDRDYESFMTEIGIDAASDSPKTEVEKTYEQFMASFSKPGPDMGLGGPTTWKTPVNYQQQQQQPMHLPPPGFGVYAPPQWDMGGNPPMHVPPGPPGFHTQPPVGWARNN